MKRAYHHLPRCREVAARADEHVRAEIQVPALFGVEVAPAATDHDQEARIEAAAGLNCEWVKEGNKGGWR